MNDTTRIVIAAAVGAVVAVISGEVLARQRPQPEPIIYYVGSDWKLRPITELQWRPPLQPSPLQPQPWRPGTTGDLNQGKQ